MIFAPGFPPWRVGGEEYYSFYQARNLIGIGHTVYVIAENNVNRTSIFDLGRGSKISLVKRTATTSGFLKSIVTMMRYALFALRLKTRPNIIHGHDTIGPGIAAVLTAKILRVPVVITWHGAELIEKRFSFIGNLARRFVCRYADGVIVNSQLFERLALDNVGQSCADKFRVIPPGVDTFEFRPGLDGNEMRVKLGVSDSFLVLSVGRLERVKGFDTLVRTVPYVAKNLPEVKFVVVGAGSKKESLSKLAGTLGVQKNIIFTGFIPRAELPLYYSGCDVFLVPTRSEGFGMVFLEAWSCGKPIVVTPQAPAIVSLVRQRGGGIVSNNDPAELGRILTCLLKDSNLRLKMGEDGRRIALDFSWRKMVEKTIDFYRNVNRQKQV